MKSHIFTILIIFAALFLWAESVRACSCMSNQTAGSAFESARFVGIFKLVRRERDPAATGYQAEIDRPVLSVVKVFKGDLQPGREVTFQEGECYLSFKDYRPGTEFLFYLNRTSFRDEKYWGIFCGSRFQFLKGANADLSYIENIDRLRGKTRLSGNVFQWFLAAVEGDKRGAEDLKGWPVEIRGNGKTHRTKTDEKGFYEVYGLEPGRYRITSRKIKGYGYSRPDGLPYIEVEIEPGRHTEENIIYIIDNAIRGRVLDANGLSLEKVRLLLIPATGKVTEGFSEETWTKPGGYFELESIPAGSYLVFVYGKDDVTKRMPDDGFYYGGTTDRKKASVITVRPGQVISDLVIRAPEK